MSADISAEISADIYAYISADMSVDASAYKYIYMHAYTCRYIRRYIRRYTCRHICRSTGTMVILEQETPDPHHLGIEMSRAPMSLRSSHSCPVCILEETLGAFFCRVVSFLLSFFL